MEGLLRFGLASMEVGGLERHHHGDPGDLVVAQYPSQSVAIAWHVWLALFLIGTLLLLLGPRIVSFLLVFVPFWAGALGAHYAVVTYVTEGAALPIWQNILLYGVALLVGLLAAILAVFLLPKLSAFVMGIAAGAAVCTVIIALYPRWTLPRLALGMFYGTAGALGGFITMRGPPVFLRWSAAAVGSVLAVGGAAGIFGVALDTDVMYGAVPHSRNDHFVFRTLALIAIVLFGFGIYWQVRHPGLTSSKYPHGPLHRTETEPLVARDEPTEVVREVYIVREGPDNV
mmetsp:Transcript_3024/g.8331  ORF Transcript_3024/g.8331 Transcript_3024/m.8331 type:complete len:286 (-) Transcript_3024:718-1575(-)